MRLIALNTETTGLSPESGDKIVEIGAIEIDGGQILADKTFHKLVDPERDIPQEVVRIHGIDTKTLNKGNAKPFSNIGREFLDFIEGATLVTHNAAFDLGFIANELSLAGLPDIGDMDVIDSLELARQKYPDQRNSLDALCNRFNICPNHRQTHGALSDASLLAKVYLEMTKNDSNILKLRKAQDHIACESIGEDARQAGHSSLDNINQQSISAIVADVYHELEDLYEGNIKQGIPTGFTELDELTHGLLKRELIVIGGRPSMGKTAFAINLVGNIALRSDDQFQIAVFSLDISAQQWMKRMLATEAKVDFLKLRTGKFTNEDWVNFASTSGLLAKSNIYIDENNSIENIISRCRMLKERDCGLDVVFIDFLDLIKNIKMSPRKIPYALKEMANELNISVVVLSQLNRKLENRADKRPLLSDIVNESVELNADMVMLLYRDQVYNSQLEDKGLAEVIVAKNRRGSMGHITLKFVNKYCEFKDVGHSEF